MLHVDVRRRTVIDDGCLLGCHFYHDLRYIFSPEAMGLPERLDGVERGENRPSYRPFLDGCSRNLVALTELAHELQGFCVTGKCEEEVAFSGKHIRDRGKAMCRKQRSLHA